MKAWFVGCTIAAIAVTGVFLASKKPEPHAPVQEVHAVSNAIAAAVPEPPTPPAVVLDRVIETADIDSLLDPPAIPRADVGTNHEPMLIRVGYEEPVSPAVPPSVVPAIPPARDFDQPITCLEVAQPVAITPGDGLVFPLPSWEDEYRPGTIWRPRSIPLETEPRRVFPTQASTFDMGKEANLLMKWDPLESRDSELLKNESSSSTLLNEETRSDAGRGAVRRAYGVFHVENQLPESRAEWYTRWFGKERLSNMFSDEAIAAMIRHKSENPEPLFTSWAGVFGGN
jgi:hypothetical protein